MSTPEVESSSITQQDMAHRLPPARIVDRVSYLEAAVAGRRTMHVGFVDSGCWAYHTQFDKWLHAHLDASASELVGLDLDSLGVDEAVRRGYEAYCVDCSDDAAVAALGLSPAEVIVAGEIIEHLDNSGSFLEGLHSLTGTGGALVVTTPNSSGLMNAVSAAFAGYEVNHPDHVTLYSCFTLCNLLERHGWAVEEVATYVPEVKESDGLHGRMKLLATGARAVLGIERLLGRLGRPYAADGLIVRAVSTRGASGSD
ncbi:MAG: methyltransferase domain-containing protein [Microthrixaceae bacterium]